MKALLNLAADLIEQKGWTQGAMALDAAGTPTKALSPDAVCYCTLGALAKAAGGHERVEGRLVSTLAKQLKVYSIVDWNDTPGRTKEEVIAALRGKPL